MAFPVYHDCDININTNVMQHPDVMECVTSIANRIKTRRKELGLSQEGLGKLVGVGQTAIANWESKSREKPRELLALAKALRCDPDWLETGVAPGKLSDQMEFQLEQFSKLFRLIPENRREEAFLKASQILTEILIRG